LAPAYDICHAYKPDSIWVSQHALSINGKRKNITLDDFLTIGKSMNIKNAKDIIKQVGESVSKWDKFANQVGVDTAKKIAIKKTLIKL